MSDLRVALVSEGPTDAVIIEAALRAILPRPFVLTSLQPEATRPKLGQGWGGVFKWCREIAARGASELEQDPTLFGFDLFIVHADADVADFGYEDCGQDIVRAAQGLPPLPIARPCPPAQESADVVRERIRAWLGFAALGPRTVLCVPSKVSEAWLIAAVFDEPHAILHDLECNRRLEAQLAVLPLAARIRKSRREYATRQPAITEAWDRVRRRCTQADRFSTDIEGVFPRS